MERIPNEEIETFAKNIVWLRTNYDLTMQEMATALGTSVTTLKKIENGDFPSRVMYKVYIRLRSNFRLDYKYIFKNPLSKSTMERLFFYNVLRGN